MMKILLSLSLLASTSCSLFGKQSEEGPQYKVLKKDGDYEIRKYESYIIAKTTVAGTYKEATSQGFRILANYIFGGNKSQKKISMTSPVQMQKDDSEKIAMTTPVQMQKQKSGYTMTFFMPSEYKMKELPVPNDKRIEFEEVSSKIIASYQYTWYASEEKNSQNEKKLRRWLKKFKKYQAAPEFSSAGYNPPWTIPFFRRNEVHIELTKVPKT
jgi:hypothetical protein